jgi:hypothetical protein
MRGNKFRDVLEDLELVVLRDALGPRSYRVTAKGHPVAFYDLYEDGAFRHGWVERKDGQARIDCLSWVEWYAELMEQGYIPAPAVRR